MIYLTASDLKIEYRALLLLAYTYNTISLRLLTYCVCNNAHAIARQEFGEGFIPLPIKCSRCKKTHYNYDDLRFDLTFEVKHKLNNKWIIQNS